MSARRAALASGLLAALALTGCSSGDGAPGGAASPSVVPQATEEQGVAGIDPTSEASAPSEGECSALPYDDDGDYSAGEAGTARIPLEGDALVVEEVLPGEGWEHRVTTETADRVEITFTGEDGVTTLRATLGGDALAMVEVCAG